MEARHLANPLAAVIAVVLGAGCAVHTVPPSTPLATTRAVPPASGSRTPSSYPPAAPQLPEHSALAGVDQANRADVAIALARFYRAEVRVGRDLLRTLLKSLGARVAPALDGGQAHLVPALLRSLRDTIAAVEPGRVPAAKRHEVHDVVTVVLADLVALQAAVEACGAATSVKAGLGSAAAVEEQPLQPPDEQRLGCIRRALGIEPPAQAGVMAAQPAPAVPVQRLSPETLALVDEFLHGRGQGTFPIPFNERVRTQLAYVLGSRRLPAWMSRMGGFRPMAEEVFRARGLPLDLLAIALIESDLKPAALSPASALGMWQFMHGTYQAPLCRALPDGASLPPITNYRDGRLDPRSSTVAAANLLGHLHRYFRGYLTGTARLKLSEQELDERAWPLAIASYNRGRLNVLADIERCGPDFWSFERPQYRTYRIKVVAPRRVGKRTKMITRYVRQRRIVNRCYTHEETYNYVPRFYAAALAMQLADRLGYLQGNERWRFDETLVHPGLSLAGLARCASADQSAMEALNPELLAGVTPPTVAGPESGSSTGGGGAGSSNASHGNAAEVAARPAATNVTAQGEPPAASSDQSQAAAPGAPPAAQPTGTGLDDEWGGRRAIPLRIPEGSKAAFEECYAKRWREFAVGPQLGPEVVAQARRIRAASTRTRKPPAAVRRGATKPVAVAQAGKPPSRSAPQSVATASRAGGKSGKPPQTSKTSTAGEAATASKAGEALLAGNAAGRTRALPASAIVGPAPKSVSKTATKTETKTATKMATKTASKAASKPASGATARPAPRQAASRVSSRPAARPATKPPSAMVKRAVAGPAPKVIAKPDTRAARKPRAATASRPATKLAGRPATRVAPRLANQATSRPATKAASRPAAKTDGKRTVGAATKPATRKKPAVRSAAKS